MRAVRALADLYAPGVGARVGAVAQSAVALARPSDYWIDVIAAGRRVRLADAQRAAGQRADDEGARVGAVVAALMRCADVAAACADVVVDDGGGGGALALARTFWAEATAAAPRPTRRRAAAAAPPPPLTLDAAAAAAGDENAAFWVGDGPDAAKRKLKKAFCEPGNADANPPLALGAALVESGLVAALAVARAPENGGDARYGADDLDRLVADVARRASTRATSSRPSPTRSARASSPPRRPPPTTPTRKKTPHASRPSRRNSPGRRSRRRRQAVDRRAAPFLSWV